MAFDPRSGPRLALGTVQFGIPYGATRPSGAIEPSEIRQILSEALASGVDMLDTAPAYGDAEARIGSQRPPKSDFRIVSKVSRISSAAISADDILAIRRQVQDSIVKLGTDSLYAILLHDIGDLEKPGADKLVRELSELKRLGLVGRIGVSVYDVQDVATATQEMPLDVIQLPLNVFDQRFARDGIVSSLASHGVEVHVRSVFLQGVLALQPDRLPVHLRALGPALARFRELAANAGLSAIAAALSYVAHQEGVSRIIVGVDGLRSFQENVAGMRAALSDKLPQGLDELSCTDSDLTDPRRWRQ